MSRIVTLGELQVSLQFRSLRSTRSSCFAATGELIIRHALADVFSDLGVSLRILRSDAEFDACKMSDYDIILLDSWTWAMRGWVPKRNLRGHEARIYILDFFGASSLHKNAWKEVTPQHILTAFKSPWNTFLGYYVSSDRLNHYAPQTQHKAPQGVIWGKDPKHYHDKENMLRQIADKVTLVSTSTANMVQHENIRWVGHQTADQWLTHLAQSKFLIGLGNPLLGPSAVDAVSLGCMFLDPVYKEPALEAKYRSQHPYLSEALSDYVCRYKEGDADDLQRCVDQALAANLTPQIPPELTREAYTARVKSIFNL